MIARTVIRNPPVRRTMYALYFSRKVTKVASVLSTQTLYGTRRCCEFLRRSNSKKLKARPTSSPSVNQHVRTTVYSIGSLVVKIGKSRKRMFCVLMFSGTLYGNIQKKSVINLFLLKKCKKTSSVSSSSLFFHVLLKMLKNEFQNIFIPPILENLTIL
jgi:hypothetical protein